jgi:anti-sigma factor ChrR (cupin superfamily)
MLVTHRDRRPWRDAGVEGIERARTWDRQYGVAVEFCRMRAGSVYPRHPHASWEQMYVVDGAIDVDGARLEAGDHAFTEPGEWHEVRAEADAVVLLIFGPPIVAV